jgi:hypothetical protein
MGSLSDVETSSSSSSSTAHSPIIGGGGFTDIETGELIPANAGNDNKMILQG